MSAPLEYGELVGYSLVVWPPPERPFAPGSPDVYETVDEARAVRNHINAGSARRQFRIVEVREVVVE